MGGDGVEGAVAIVADDAGGRESLAALLEVHGFRARQYRSAEAFLAAAGALDGLGCLVVDLSTAGIRGLELLDRLAAAAPPPPAILIADEVTDPLRLHAQEAGAVAVLDRQEPPLALVAQVRRAAGFCR
ncbi:MAG: response regulator [Rhodospirillaceae bacterium]